MSLLVALSEVSHYAGMHRFWQLAVVVAPSGDFGTNYVSIRAWGYQSKYERQCAQGWAK